MPRSILFSNSPVSPAYAKYCKFYQIWGNTVWWKEVDVLEFSVDDIHFLETGEWLK